jgi:hypothetical protein
MIGVFCQRHSIEALGLLKYMNTPEHKERHFFKRGARGHPNKEGNSSHPGSTLIILPSCSPCT